jgi:hypothetical protein
MLSDIKKNLGEDGCLTENDSSSNRSKDVSETNIVAYRNKIEWPESYYLIEDEIDLQNTFECGGSFVDAKTEIVKCRVFIRSHAAWFRDTKGGVVAIPKIKIYRTVELCPSDYIAIGLIFTPSKFTLIVNGFAIEFMQMHNDGLQIAESAVDPQQLPHDVKLKIVPAVKPRSYMEFIRTTLTTPGNKKLLVFSKCHYLVEFMVDNLTCGWCTLATKHSNFLSPSNGSCYQSMKITRHLQGRWELIKLY